MDSHLSQFIRQGLKQTGLNQTQFVRAMGYQNTAKGHRRLTAWLRGDETPNEVQVRRIAEALDVSPEAVFKVITMTKRSRPAPCCLASYAGSSRSRDSTTLNLCTPWATVTQRRATVGHRLATGRRDTDGRPSPSDRAGP